LIREAVLGEQRRAARTERRALDGDRVEPTALGEDVVDIVDHVGHDEAVDRGHPALSEGRATGDPRHARQCPHTTGDRPQLHEVTSVHRLPPSDQVKPSGHPRQ
jgi:hypothetical protein